MDLEPTEVGGVDEENDVQAGKEEPLTDPESFGPREVLKQEDALNKEGASSPEGQEPPGAVVQQDEAEDLDKEDLSPVEQNQRGLTSHCSTSLGGDETDSAFTCGVEFFSTNASGTPAGSMVRPSSQTLVLACSSQDSQHSIRPNNTQGHALQCAMRVGLGSLQEFTQGPALCKRL